MINLNSSSPSIKLRKLNTAEASLQSSTFSSTFKLDEEINEISLHETISHETEADPVYLSSINSGEFVDEEEKEGVNITFKNKQQNKKEIHFISIDLLLKKIAFKELEGEESLQTRFIKHYKNFILIDILTQKIINLYEYFTNNYSCNDEVKLPIGIIAFLNSWAIQMYKEDFIKNSEVKTKIKRFYEKLLNNKVLEKHFSNGEIDSVYELFDQENKDDIEYSINHLKGRKKSHNIISFKSIKMLTHHVNSENFDILNWNELDIARQLTLTSQQLMSKVEYKELLMACWTKKDKYNRAPNVMKVIDRFNKFSLWMIEEILAYDKKRMRAGVIEKLLKIAVECKNMNNFNDCVNIVSAINNFIVKNLKKTWKVMNPEVFPLLDSLNEFCSYDNNYKQLRSEMNNCLSKPCIPYLGLFLKELAFIEEGPKYVKTDCLVNLDKIKKVSRSIEFFFKFQIQAYLLRPVDQLAFLSELHPKTEDEIESMANQMEPVWLLKTKSKLKRITSTDSKNYQLKPTLQAFSTKESSSKVIFQIDDHF